MYFVRGGNRDHARGHETIGLIQFLSLHVLQFHSLHLLSFPVLMVMVLVAGALSPLSMIGRGAVSPNIVASEEPEMANGFAQTRMSFVPLFGPAPGGLWRTAANH